MILYEAPVFLQTPRGFPRVTEYGLQEKKTGIFLEEAPVSEFPDVGVQESFFIQVFEKTADPAQYEWSCALTKKGIFYMRRRGRGNVPVT
jgi:hypothetical protein